MVFASLVLSLLLMYNDAMNGYFQGFSEHTQFGSESLCPKQNRIGLLGGTFNPIHCGHLDMAYIALYEFALGEVVFLPLGMPPHKRDEYIAPAFHRTEMIRLAISQESRFTLSTIETSREGLTYTVDTLEALRRLKRNTAFYYIIGADTLFELPSWRNYERVMLLTDFICILRPGQDDQNVRRYADELNSKYGQKIYIAGERGPNISSSIIRQQAAENKLKSGLVPDTVAQYIKLHRVYMEEE